MGSWDLGAARKIWSEMRQGKNYVLVFFGFLFLSFSLRQHHQCINAHVYKVQIIYLIEFLTIGLCIYRLVFFIHTTRVDNMPRCIFKTERQK